ncbi:hypothetical protein K8I61_17250 [bacterium]|nr:hypothetical protein [bacterium]
MAPLEDNPYEDEQPITVKLCEAAKGEGGAWVPDFATVLYEFPPVGSVAVRNQAKVTEEGKKDASTKSVQAKDFEPVEIVFQIEILSDEEGGDLSAIDKYDAMHAALKAKNDAGGNRLFAVRHPMVDRSDLEFVYVAQFEAADTVGADLVTANVTLREIKAPATARKKGDGAAPGGGDGGSGPGAGSGGSSGANGSGNSDATLPSKSPKTESEKQRSDAFRDGLRQAMGLGDNG